MPGLILQCLLNVTWLDKLSHNKGSACICLCIRTRIKGESRIKSNSELFTEVYNWFQKSDFTVIGRYRFNQFCFPVLTSFVTIFRTRSGRREVHVLHLLDRDWSIPNQVSLHSKSFGQGSRIPLSHLRKEMQAKKSVEGKKVQVIQ